MDVNLNVRTNVLTGKQTITYFNNSPDTLSRIFIHLFWNAFRPNSMMDITSRKTENLVLGKSAAGAIVTDFDTRFKKRINELKPDEQGSCEVVQITMNGRLQIMKYHETILEVVLDKPITPASSSRPIY